MENLSDVVAEMRKLKARWCDPEVIDDEEELSVDVIPFLEAAFPILEATETKFAQLLAQLQRG
jgi:hypothetical protein